MLRLKNRYNPDVLDCIANLSNDEVFTSPKLANEMLDMLPQELFENPDTKFCDIACKSGVFLREIVKRLDKGLESQIPDKQERIDHILHKQVFGIAITELTAQLSRRTLYCSKYACAIDSDSDAALWEDDKDNVHIAHSYSISEFDDSDVNGFCINPIQGNLRFNNQCKHTFKNKTCTKCGANSDTFKEYDYAYEMIHITDNFMEVLKDMQFDVIISNPPYQLNIGDTSDKPIYHDFVEQAKKLEPRYLAMIIPSRWMSGGKGLDKFRADMITDKHITKMHDFINSKDCFAGVDIKGGVCYFLRERDREDKCKIITHLNDGDVKTSIRYLSNQGDVSFIRIPELAELKEKIVDSSSDFVGMDTIVYAESSWRISNVLHNDMPDEINKLKKSARNFFASNVFDMLSSNVFFDTEPNDGEEYIKLYGRSNNHRCFKYINSKYVDAPDNVNSYKVFLPKANGSGAIGEVLSTPLVGHPLVGHPLVGHTQTFISLGKFDTEEEANNLLKYIQTKFARCMLGILKITQDNKKNVWRYVPMQDFTSNSDIDWTKSVDDISHQLYAKYCLSDADINFIETNISVMDDTTVTDDIVDDDED